MKKTLLRVSAVLLLSFQLATAFAQAPQKMSYQAVIRNSSNTLVTSSSVGMQVSILQGSATGTAVYVETQTATTNANGLVTIEIGNGTAVTGTFSAIDWSAGPYFIMTETDPNGGSSYTIAGTTQLMSVPYALYAATSGNGAGATGATGATGADGMNGTNGIDGMNGTNGVDGAMGATGADGINGTNGIDGAIGATGATGADGMNGTNGVDGIAGATGVTGATGAMGMMGMPGMPGTNGTNGATGATGATGTAGTNGSNGTNGIDGAMGSTGATGAMGPMGPMGMGMPGMNGTNGTNGATGATGATGTAGTNGTNGTVGATGAMGATGSTGTAGTNGTNGATGAIGATGVVGSTGSTGATGATGVTGATGLADGTAAGNTPYWNGTAWVTNSSNIFNNGGNVGIGNTAPAHKLDIQNAGNASMRLQSLGVNSFTSFLMSNPERDFMLTNNAIDDQLSFYYNGANRLQFNLTNQYFNSGNVGIGTITPNAALQFGNVQGNRRLVLWEDANNDHEYYGFGMNNNALRYQVSSTVQSHVFYAATSATASNELMRIRGNGNVGIGTSGPSRLLNINSAGPNVEVSTIYTKTGSTEYTIAGIASDADGITVGGTPLNGKFFMHSYNSDIQIAAIGARNIEFGTNGVNRMYINSTGNVGVGTITPSAKLEVAGSTDNTQLIVKANATQSSNNPLIKLQNSAGTDLMWIGSNATQNTFVGLGTGNSTAVTAVDNTFIGSMAGYTNASGLRNTALGRNALNLNAAGNDITAIGNSALLNNTASENTAVGASALRSNTTGFGNVAMGFEALYFNNSNQNTSVGYKALRANGGGFYNTAMGFNALSTSQANMNTAVGAASQMLTSTGASNTSIGVQTLENNTIGSDNTAIGKNALRANTTGANNTALGSNSGPTIATLTNTTAIGANAIPTASNMIRVGAATVTVCEVPVAWTVSSDRNLKTNVQEDMPGLNLISQLRPVTYNYIAHGSEGIRFNGLIAQELDATLTQLGIVSSLVTKPNAQGEGSWGIRYAELTLPLIKAVQEQQAIIEGLKKQNAEILQRLTQLENK
ncbi:MAG: hypothetical protein K0S44_2753 [Bacteroidetes bacterium]|jgi:hypothetical protein|nr:hypothetical protein [Bacteroidota bacterium]